MEDDLTALVLLYKKKRGMSWGKIAQLMDTTPSNLSRRMEKGITNWKLGEAVRLFHILGIPVQAFRDAIHYDKGE